MDLLDVSPFVVTSPWLLSQVPVRNAFLFSPQELVCKQCFDNALICFLCLLQVSFYRGEIPNNLPEEVARKRKGDDSQWLATLPLRLPVSWNVFFFPYFMMTLIYFYY